MKSIYELRIDNKVISSSDEYNYIFQRAIGIDLYERKMLSIEQDFINPTNEHQLRLKSSERMLDSWSNGMNIVKVDTYTHHLNANQYMYVKMHDYYTATVRCLKTFEEYIIREEDCILDIVCVSENCPHWFVQGVKKIIKSYKI